MQRIAARALLIICCLLVGKFSFTQSPTEPPTSTIVSRSELVVVPVVVTDKSGKHVPGLTKADFVLQEDGKARTIGMFEEVRSSAAKPPDRKRAVGDYTNLMVRDSSPQRVLLIVMDLVNTPFLSQARARNELLDFLSKSLSLGEPAALLAITNDGIREIHPFTTDTKVLIAALKRVRGTVSPMETTGSDGNYLSEQELQQVQQEQGAIAALEAKSNAVFNDAQQRNAIRSTMLAMEQIAQAYSGIPGRKTMLWATSGFPFLLDDPRNSLLAGGTDMIHYYEHAWRAMNDANIAIYPINAEGLVNYEYDRSFDVRRAGMRRGGSSIPSMDRYRLTVDSLRNFADATGGKACVDRNDLSKCFAEATKDSEQYYLLGFYLGSETRKPGWHKLKVQVGREHVNARSRTGYLVGDPKNGGVRDLEIELATALVSPLDYTGVAMDVRWLGQKHENGKTKAQFVVKLPVTAFTIDSKNNNAFSLRIAAVAFTLNGKPGPEMLKVVKGNLKPESIAEITAGGITYKDEIVVPPGKYNVKFMIRDNQSGKLGTVSAPLEAK